MTKIISFSRSKRAEEEEEEDSAAMAAAGEYRDLEGGGNKNDDGTPAGSGDGVAGRGDVGLFLAGIAAYFVSFIGIYYIVLGNFYLPPEAREDGGGTVVLAGATVGVIFILCRCRRRDGDGSSSLLPADDEPALLS